MADVMFTALASSRSVYFGPSDDKTEYLVELESACVHFGILHVLKYIACIFTFNTYIAVVPR